MVSGPDVDANLAEAGRLIAEAAEAGAQLVALPEYFPLITADETAKVRIREHDDGSGPMPGIPARNRPSAQGVADRRFLPDWTPRCPTRSRTPPSSTDDEGRRVARYDKIHLFGFRKGDEYYDESATIEAGNEVVSFEGPCGRIGLSICYDLRFPEFFRAMGTVDLIVLPAAFTYTTGKAHWEMLLRARAVENQCYVLASAQGGKHPSGRRTWGDSMIIDPWGEVLARLPEGPGVVVADLDPARIADVRASLPALQHRKIG